MPDLTTEQRNQRSTRLDEMSAAEIVAVMSQEDQLVAQAVEEQLADVAQAAQLVANRFRDGGRLLYLGAGTSGRLGVLDAAECPPTFSTPPELVVGIIAGGPAALTRAIEGAEDNPAQAQADLQAHALNDRDVVMGIATSGHTPYVLGGLKYAQQIGARTIGLTCNADSPLHQHAELVIAPVVGPEVVSGSTRLKAGTATKMVLNMITTTAMVLIGKTYGNLMVDLTATNEKLKLRSVRIVSEVTGLDNAAAQRQLTACGGEVKTAIVAHLTSLDAAEARHRLHQAGGRLKAAL